MNDLSRGRHNEESKVAFQIVSSSTASMRLKILELIDGELSTIEIANTLGVLPHKISGRFTELLAMNKVIKVGNKKIGRSSFGIYQRIN